MTKHPTERTITDHAHRAKPHSQLPLCRVGMAGIEAMVCPVVTALDGTTSLQPVPGRVDAFVNLDQGESRGVHMSRLYLVAQEQLRSRPLTPDTLDDILTTFLASHDSLSSKAEITIGFEFLVERPALVSEYKGTRAYQIKLGAEKTIGDSPASTWVEFTILYSSTCPCSASLSSQLMQEAFIQKFGSDPVPMTEIAKWLGSGEALVATPHAQRSETKIRLELPEATRDFTLCQWIDGFEDALQTPVQTAVKREDEQEFARRNALNLMFTEDAARRLASFLYAIPGWDRFQIRTAHLESLHPHDAVAEISGLR